MSMNNRINKSLLIPFLLTGTFFSGCDNILGPYNFISYSTSFEKNESMKDWEGGEYLRFYNDAPKGGGERSLYVSGGCVQGHEKLNLGKIEIDNLYTIRLWGKVLVSNGNLKLFTVSPESEYMELGTIWINDNDWKEYLFESKISAPIGYDLKLTASSGGKIPGGMLIDLLEISELN